ncbi:ORF MSV134 hypothetical protein [Melanoplus sanguinipes entomopoxvirus]|uniref:Uncharacterized protein n=1 Tax=Melanoplus sanguinipes entomopoxvirus TaxID=83191 RepID=Q9YVV8_MSEPV|nr:ORF MSV134 hypothetical protein [Melanoplus sanguinipes entomopoxvirus]AAC97792.1 ORF MSV134 hypothetical protein [Melanoplus sanguinipes entomopoxvirus 'O']
MKYFAIITLVLLSNSYITKANTTLPSVLPFNQSEIKFDTQSIVEAIDKINITSLNGQYEKIIASINNVVDSIENIDLGASTILRLVNPFANKINSFIDSFPIEDSKIFFTIISVSALIHSISMIFFVILVVYFVFIKTVKKKNKISMNVGYSRPRREV